MNKTIKNWKENKINKLLLIFIIILMCTQLSNALTFQQTGDHSLEEQETLTIQLITEESVSAVNFTKNQGFGTITQINNETAEFTWTPQSGDAGTYTINFTATDLNSSITRTSIINVSEETNAPKILTKTQNSTSFNSIVTIEVTTDIAATCKYGLGDASYANLEYTLYQKNTEKTMHSGSTPTLSQGEHTIYVKCKSENNKIMQESQKIGITVNLKPTASISLSPSPPLKDEMAKVSLTLSEELIDEPELKYYFDDDQTRNPITLVGSGTHWEGYIIIRATDKERIGAFEFKGIDKSNVEGTEITNGKIFIVDSKFPAQVRSAKATLQEHSVKLEWNYDDQEADNIEEYRIYRREKSGGTDYVDFFKSTDKTYYYDEDVKYNEAYYYKISAVDKAGNEGPLSQEIYLTFSPKLDDEHDEVELATETKKKLSSDLTYELEIKSAIIEKALIDVTEIESRISKTIGKNNIDAIQSTGVLALIKSQKSKLEQLQKEFLDIANQDLTPTEFKTKTNTILAKVGEEIKNTPTDISVKDSSEYQELVDDSKTEELIRLYLSKEKSELDESSINKIVKENKKIQDAITINSRIIQSEISYPEYKESWITIIKDISSTNSIDNVAILESIPESVSDSIDKIIFGEKPTIYVGERMVSWKEDSLIKKTLVYAFKKDSPNLIDSKNVKTVVATFTDDKGSNLITGFASKEDSDSSSSSPFWIPVIAGIIIITGLVAYYFYSSEDKHIDYHGGLSTKLIQIRRNKENKTSILPKEKLSNKDIHKKLVLDNFTLREDAPKTHNSAVENTIISNKELPINEENFNNRDYEEEVNKMEHFKKEFEKEFKEQQLPHEMKNPLRDDSEEYYDENQNNLDRYKEYERRRSLRNIQPKETNTKDFNIQEGKTILREGNQADVVDSEIEDAFERLSKLKDEWEYSPDMSIDRLHSLQKKTSMMRNVLDDIEEKNLEAYTDNAKRALKEALRFMNKKEQEHMMKVIEKRSILDKKVPEQNAFVLKDGVKLRSLRDLKDHLTFMQDDVYKYHVNNTKNDFYNWTRDILLQNKIASDILDISKKDDLYEYLSRL